MNESMWKHIWAIFDAWMTQYESLWNWPDWTIQKRMIEHLVNLVLISYHIDWHKFWADVEPKLESLEWEEQKKTITNFLNPIGFFNMQYCRRKHIMAKPKREAVSFWK